MVRNRWLCLLLGLLILCGVRVGAQTTTTAAYNDSRIFAAGPMGLQVNGGSYGQTQTGYTIAFDITGTKLELAIQGYWQVVIDGGDTTFGGGTFSTGNVVGTGGAYYTVTSSLTDGRNHTVVMTSLTVNGSSAYDAGNLVRVTGASPVIAGSSVYPNMQALHLGTGTLMGNQIRDSTHIRIDGSWNPNMSGYGTPWIACGTHCYGGSVTFFGNPTAISVFAVGGYAGPGGIYVSRDGANPIYKSAESNSNGTNLPPGIFPVASGYDGAVHRYELRLGLTSSVNVAWSDVILTGGTLDTTHTLSTRKSVLAYGDSIVQGFSATTMTSGIMGTGVYWADGLFFSNVGDPGFGLVQACYRLDLALYAFGFPSVTVATLKDPATQMANSGMVLSYKAADWMLIEPGINDLSSNTGFSADDTTLCTNFLALATNPNVKIYRQNLYHNSQDDGGGNAILTARRSIIASDVATINDPRLILLDVSGPTWLTTVTTMDGTHPNNVGETNFANRYTALLSNTSPLFILLRNVAGNLHILTSGIQ